MLARTWLLDRIERVPQTRWSPSRFSDVHSHTLRSLTSPLLVIIFHPNLFTRILVILTPSVIQQQRSCPRNIQYSDNITNNISNNVKFILDCFPWSRRLVIQSLNAHSSRSASFSIVRFAFNPLCHSNICHLIVFPSPPPQSSTNTREILGIRYIHCIS